MDGSELTVKVAENTQLFRSKMKEAGFTIEVSQQQEKRAKIKKKQSRKKAGSWTRPCN